MTSAPLWEVPEPHSVDDVRHDDGSVTKVRRHGSAGGRRLLVGHGNGLAVDLYYPFWSRFLDDFDVFVYDLRNHGWNTVGPRDEHNVPNMIRDQEQVVEAIAARYGATPTIGAFHSLSALTALLSDSLGTGRTGELAAWILFDPPLFKPRLGEAEFDKSADRSAELARRRTDRFRRESEFSELLHHLVLTRAVPGAADLMASTVLRESADGEGVELRCPREYEAQIFAYARTYAFLVDLGSLPCPTKVIGSDPTMTFSYMPSFNLSHINTVDYDFIPESTHFLQVEQPKECVDLMREFLEGHDLL
ncbi:MAG: alpha/beta hydrolase [Gemmatimonadota bacterium]|uniref:alpha/beta fold hydrolase n=1 Tax=Candidatus Palauibacter scopulicola TaxID=3056741 RepID=UPI002397D1CA|nr:alpha/beta hydrolase [Candidatus Palauibacter scopulicola]MDE2662420.1 alpha/beta hydrolase [Candidatus Palauibacter scopulicola]